MKNFKKGNAVLLKNENKENIYGIYGAYKLSSNEYEYELETLEGSILDMDCVRNSELSRYEFEIPNNIKYKLEYNYEKIADSLNDFEFITQNFKDEQAKLMNNIVEKNSYESCYAYSILGEVKTFAETNNQSAIELASKYVPYILETINTEKERNNKLSIEDVILNGLMMHLYHTMNLNKQLFYKKILLNHVHDNLNKITDLNILRFMNNIKDFESNNAKLYLTLEPNDILKYIDEYVERMVDINFNEINAIEKNINSFHSFLEEKSNNN